MNNEKLIKSTMDFDAIAEAEKRADGPEAINLVMTFQASKSDMLRKLMDQNGDTHSMTGFGHYCDIAVEAGFEQIYDEPLVTDDERKENLRVYWHADGFLLVVESYSWRDDGFRSVNRASLHYNLQMTQSQVDTHHDCTSSGGWAVWHEATKEFVWFGNHDVRDGLLYKLDIIRKRSTPLQTWRHISFIWLLNYVERHTKSDQWKEIAGAKISTFPDQIRDMIFNAMSTKREIDNYEG